MPPPPKPPAWLDTNLLINIEKGARPDLELALLNMQRDGHELLIPPCVEIEFVYGQKRGVADAVKARAVLNRLRIHVDTMTNQTPMQQLRIWRDEAMANGLKPGDADVVAHVRAGGAARGLRNPVLFSLDTGVQKIGTQSGVGALEPRNIPVKARPVRTQVQVHPPETPAQKPPATSPPKSPMMPPKAGSFGRLRRFANGFLEGVKGAFTAESIAAEIPEMILLLADKRAARDTIQKIQIKFIKSGFAKGVAAGVMGWTTEEVESTLMNRVTDFRVHDLGDPAGKLDRSYIFQLAEAYENYAVEVGYVYSSSKHQKWKSDMLHKGFPVLKRYGYYFGGNPEALFEYDFLDKLAWVLQPTTDAIVEPAIRLDGEQPSDPASVADSTPVLAGA